MDAPNITHHILIDLENIQPKNLNRLTVTGIKCYVFVGAKQKNIAFELAQSLQPFGEHVSYIKVVEQGPNALDFIMAFYLGCLVQQTPKDNFYIVSKDQGFKVLIDQLKSLNVKAHQVTDILLINKLFAANTRNSNSNSNSLDYDPIALICNNLKGRGSAKPRKRATLINTIRALLDKTSPSPLTSDTIDQYIEQLEKKKYIIINTEKDSITYRLPK